MPPSSRCRPLMCWPMRFSGEAPTDEAGDAGEAATDILAGIGRHVGQAAICRHLLAHAVDLLSLKSRQGVDRDSDVAILGGRKAHLHKSPSSTADGFVD